MTTLMSSTDENPETEPRAEAMRKAISVLMSGSCAIAAAEA